MKPLFADTDYWIAIFWPRDSLNAEAVRVTGEINDREIVTSEMVLVEFLNYFSAATQNTRESAAQFVEELRIEQSVRTIEQTTELFLDALELYIARPDKSWSFTDCSSMVLCSLESITEVLTNDHHFQQAGLVALLRDPV